MLNSKELARFHKLIDGEKYDRLPLVFDALGDQNRCNIVRLLIAKGDKDLSVGDLAQILGVSSSAVSQHLKILEITRVVKKRREGQRVFYRLNADDPIVSALSRAVL